MLKCLLFDLDDTLLINNMDTFAPHYYAALSAAMKPLVKPDQFRHALNAGIKAMWLNDGSQGTNAQAFENAFFSLVKRGREQIMREFDRFYRFEFEDLRQFTLQDPAAHHVMAWAFQHNLQVVIATQPVFPRQAIEARLRWAGVGAEEFPYALVTSYDLMRASKPHPLYFKDILDRLQLKAEECCMIGDSLEADMPAGALGMHTFWLQRDQGRLKEQADVDGRGNLEDLAHWLESGGIDG